MDEANTPAAVLALCGALAEAGAQGSLLAAAAAMSPLLHHRLAAVSTLLTACGTVRVGIERNLEDVSWHLQRMYRVRNAIVHGGSVPVDLTHLASHLATYLWAVLRTLISELARPNGTREVADVFEKFYWLYEEEAKLLKENPEARPPLEIILDVQKLWPGQEAIGAGS